MKSRTMADMASLHQEISEAEAKAAMYADSSLMAMQWRNRADELRKQASTLDDPYIAPKMRMLFGGDAVVGSVAIEAKFAIEAVGHILSVIKTEYARTDNSFIGKRGPTRGEAEAEMLITGTPRGSFGFELTGPEPKDLFAAENLGAVLDEIAVVIEKAASSDEEFFECLDLIDSRSFPKLSEFFRLLNDHHSTLKVHTRAKTVNVGEEGVREARLRFSQTNESQGDVVLEGVFLGAILQQYHFAIRSGNELVTGGIDPSVEDGVIIGWNRDLTNEDVQASLKETVLTTRNGQVKRKYKLLNLSPQ